jgi:cyclophilin family peptidyl-prolyl cis-trans isomerase
MRFATLAIMSVMLIAALSFPLFAQDEAQAESKSEAQAAEKPAEVKPAKNPMVVLETNYGNIRLELFPKDAPISVENFLSYVREGFYDGTVFHRVVRDFVLQAGGMNEEMKQKQQKAPIKNEALNGLKNTRGTIAVARTADINSGTSHFFINLKDNAFLDHTEGNPKQYGYAVFGAVADDASMKVVDKIAEVAVGDKGQFKNVPVKPVIIKKAMVVGEAKKEAAQEPEKEIGKDTEKEVQKKADEGLQEEQHKMQEQGE